MDPLSERLAELGYLAAEEILDEMMKGLHEKYAQEQCGPAQGWAYTLFSITRLLARNEMNVEQLVLLTATAVTRLHTLSEMDSNNGGR